MEMEIETPFPSNNNKRGGWLTFPFIIGSTAALTLGAGGWMSNLIVYLIEVFNVKSIDAAQIFNLVNGSTSLIPVLSAIIADSFFGCYSVVWISSFVSFLGIVLIFLTAALHSLRPQPCENNSISSCETPSKLQLSVLYSGIILATIGIGGLRSTLTTMGADQFHKPKDQTVYFNWYFVTTYVAAIIASTAFVYIEENVGWAVGFGLSVGFSLLGSAVFLLGTRFYHRPRPEKSPYIGVAHVVVAVIRKRKVPLSSEREDFYYGHDGEGKIKEVDFAPTKSLRFLNRAALKTSEDINLDGTNSNLWKTCTVQQVEELKSLIKIFPLWSSSIFLGTPIGIQTSLVVLQALTMDRSLGRHHFKIPAASITVSILVTTAVFLSIFDRLILPMCQKLVGRILTPLERIGVGHLFNIASMTVSAVVELKRRNNPPSAVPISVLWLVPQLVFMGIGEAFHFPGQVELYYKEFPESMKSLSTAMIYLLIAIAFYLSTALIDVVRKVTVWLPDDINKGRLDNVYWMLVVSGVLNFGYYLVCAKLYKYQNVDKVEKDESSHVQVSDNEPT